MVCDRLIVRVVCHRTKRNSAAGGALQRRRWRRSCYTNTAQKHEHNIRTRHREEAPTRQHKAPTYTAQGSQTACANPCTSGISENGFHLSYRALETKNLDSRSRPIQWRQREGALFWRLGLFFTKIICKSLPKIFLVEPLVSEPGGLVGFLTARLGCNMDSPAVSGRRFGQQNVVMRCLNWQPSGVYSTVRASRSGQ